MAKKAGHDISNGDDSVGYGRPPKPTQFKKGAPSPNPAGRGKGNRDKKNLINEALNGRIRVEVAGKTKTVTKLEGIILSTVNAALKGDARARETVFKLTQILAPPDETPPVERTLEEDREIVDELLARLRGDLAK